MTKVYYKQLVLILALFLTNTFIHAQGCPNANFSMNNFNNWSGFTGNYGNPGQTPGIVAGRHTIINTPGIDPFTCGGLSVLPPGGTVSARLGNSNTGAQGERLRYSLTVDQSNALFVYKYAVVLENPSGHASNEQPEFSVRILNQAGQQIGGSCGIYTVYGGQPGQNFQTCGGVTWLPWTLVGINLQPYIGQTIQVEFSTKDCSLSGHFGYAYVAAECLPLIIDVNYCEGSNAVTLTAPTGFQNYLWSNGATTQSISVLNPTIGSTYTCTLTSFSNQGSCTVNVSAQVFPTVIVPGFENTPGCAGSQLQFFDTSTVNNNNTIQFWSWNFGDGNTSPLMNPFHTYANGGTYDVQLIVTTDDGCSDTIVKQITIAPPPLVQFTTADICIGDTAQFVNSTTDPDPLTYEWDFGDGSALDTNYSTSHFYSTPGTYTVTLTAEKVNGCSGTMSIPINVNALPAINAGPDLQVCPNTPVTLAGTGASTYTWTNNVIDNVPFTPIASQTYVVEGTDVNGCVNSDTMSITFFPTPVVNAGPDQTVCFGTAVTFAGSGADSYSWNNNVVDGQMFTPQVGNYTLVVTGTGANNCQNTDTTILIVNPIPNVSAGPDQLICIASSTVLSGSGAQTYIWDNGVVNNSPFVPSASATYTVVGTSIHGCQATDQVIVNLEPATVPSFVAPVLSGCAPLDVILSNTSTGTPSVSCTWNFGDGTTESNCGTVPHQYVDPGCYDVTLTTVTALGCVWEQTVPNYICVYPNPVAGFTPIPGILSELQPISQMSNGSTGAVEYIWNFGDGSAISTEENPEHTFPVEPVENHVVELIAISEYGCTDTATAVIVINEELLYYIPNTFTPDNDEFNQTFQPVFTSGFDPYDFNMLIFNRWGEILFESNNAQIGWDGTYKGEIVKEGAYTWKIEFKRSVNDARVVINGHINVLR